MVRCILFDLGQTLWDSRTGAEPAKRAANQRVVALLRQHLAPDALPTSDDDLLGDQFREMFDEAKRAMVRRAPHREPHGPQAVVEALRRWGIAEGEHTLATALFEALNVRMAEAHPVFDDVLPTLATLRERGFVLGVATNRPWGGQSFRDDLQTLGLLAYLEPRAIAVSADLGVRKPHPGLFVHALRGVGVAPWEAAMVGDSLRKDILGAQALGMIAVWTPRPKHLHTMHRHAASGGALPQAGEGSHLPARTLDREGSVQEYLRGEISPDAIIEQVSDVLDLFSKPGEQYAA